MDQDRIIQEVLSALNKRPVELTKRLNYLENAEYAAMNYYGNLVNTNQYVTVPATTIRKLVLREGPMRGFTFGDSSLICNKSGLYLLNCFINVKASVSAEFSFYPQSSVFVAGDFGLLHLYANPNAQQYSSCLPIELEEDDEIILNIGTGGTGISFVIYAVALTLTRMDDIS